ncbi:hypothetical protein [Blastococcus xanthinilyticus]|uniref:Uncharacterized protein n=1 Tax=Blastococcus xanthinilyticus TaxID=1564164 RepID=A0A5S5D0Z1_9ACTN|nr:hypothetical protein [Blastococcus xanthinilyticus]TYP88442.1 hypothetical protein BD833_104146 [Blastococcus xanthinilyticus]
MADDELGLHIKGAVGFIDATALAAGLTALLRLLGDPPAAGEDSAAPVWAVSLLRTGSLDVAVRPGGAVTRESVERLQLVRRGIGSLHERAGAPAGWNQEDLRNLLRIGDIVGLQGVEAVDIIIDRQRPDDWITLSGSVLNHARESLSETEVSFGSVRGRIDRYLSRGNRREVGLTDESSGRPVRVWYPESLQARMVAAIERDVVIWGEVRRNTAGHKTSIRAEDLELVERRPPEPARALVGMFDPDWTDGISNDEWLRLQRGG